MRIYSTGQKTRFRFIGIVLLLCLFCIKVYSQDEVREDLINPDDYSHFLENISDSVQYLKENWNAELVRINDTDHDVAKIRKNTNALLKFLKDKRHDIKNLGAIGKGGEALKSGYVAYLNDEITAITNYFTPFNEAQTEANFNKLSNGLKEENEQEKALAETLNGLKETYENENRLGEEGSEE